MNLVSRMLLLGSFLVLGLTGCGGPEDSGDLKTVAVTAQLTSPAQLTPVGAVRTNQKSLFADDVQAAFAIAITEQTELSSIGPNSPVQASGPVAADNTVTLSVPINTSLRLVVGGFAEPVQTLEEALSNSPVAVYTSSIFQVGASTKELTLLLTQVPASTTEDINDNTSTPITDNLTDNVSLQAAFYLEGCSELGLDLIASDNTTPASDFQFPIIFSESMDNTTIRPSSDCTQDAVQLLQSDSCLSFNPEFISVPLPQEVKALLPFIPPDNQSAFIYTMNTLSPGNYTVHINTQAKSIFGRTLSESQAWPVTLVADNGSDAGCRYFSFQP